MSRDLFSSVIDFRVLYYYLRHFPRLRCDSKMRTQRSSLIDPLKKAKEHDAETAQSYKDSLDGLLWRMEGGGSFAASGAYSKAPLPDLFLQGFGPVPLPLAQRDAEAICKERTAEDTGEVI